MVHFYIFHFVVQQFSNFSREAFRYMIGIMTTSNNLVFMQGTNRSWRTIFFANVKTQVVCFSH